MQTLTTTSNARLDHLEALYAALLAWKADQRNVTWQEVERVMRELKKLFHR